MSDNLISNDTEKKTMTADEFMEAYKSGKGAISQMKEDADGTKHFFNVYGDVHDGIDHFLNVFIDHESLSKLFAAALHGKLKQPADKKSDDAYKGYQMTIDYTDEPIMWVFNSTKEEFRLAAYQRDQKKGFYDPAVEGRWEKENGNFQITNEKLQEDNNLIYVTAFYSLRSHLMAEGVIEKLRELKKYSAAGVIVSLKDEDSISYKIVQGRERPDLPCEMFLFGRTTCRPYLDEMLAQTMLSNMTMDERIKAAEEGNPDAMEYLAKAYLDGDDEVNQDLEKSFHWWEKLAEAGSATAQFNTGLYYAKGCGVKRDFAKAAEWMQRAADGGDEDATGHFDLYKSAEENLQKASAGDAAAQAKTSELFMILGKSVDQFNTEEADFKEAFKWAKKSADQGNPDGLYNLGLCYEYGRGVEEDAQKAANAYKKAADQNHAPSQWNLACFYLNGTYGAAGHNGPFTIWNETEGLMLAYKSADQGYELAINGLEQSGNTVEQIIEYYANEENRFMLEGTQYQGRADRCENIHPGDELTYKFAKDDHGLDCLEFFFKGGSVGLMYQYHAAKLMALLRLNKVKLKTTVRSIIPKSKRGKRARNAEVTLNLTLTEIKTETLKGKEESKKTNSSNESVQAENIEKKNKPVEQSNNVPTEQESTLNPFSLTKVESFLTECVSKDESIIHGWQNRFNEIAEETALKIYSSEEELKADMRSIIMERDGYGTQLDDLILEIDNAGKQFIQAGGDYQAIQMIADCIDSIIDDSPMLNLDFGTSGAMNSDIGSSEFKVSTKSAAIQRTWRNKYNDQPEVKAVAEKSSLESSIAKLNSDLSAFKTKVDQITRDEKQTQKKLDDAQSKLNTLKENYELDKKTIIDETENKTNGQKSVIEGKKKERDDTERQISEMTVQLSKLSFFRRSAKKELAGKIESAKNSLPALSSQIHKEEEKLDEIKNGKEEKLKALDAKVVASENEVKKLKDEVEAFPRHQERVESEIKKTTSKITEKEEKLSQLMEQYGKEFFTNMQKAKRYFSQRRTAGITRSGMVTMQRPKTRREQENDVLKEELIEAILGCGEDATVGEILSELNPSYECTAQRASALLRQLQSEERVTKRIVDGKARFSLGNTNVYFSQRRTTVVSRTDTEQETKTKREQENDVLKKELIEAILACGEDATITEILSELNPSYECTAQRASALLRQLKNEGLVTKEVVDGKARFSVS